MPRAAIASTVLALVVSGAAFAAAQTGTEVKLRKTSHGRVLATITGRTLYLSTGDEKNTSHCGGSCLTYWRPLLTTGKPVALGGVHQSLLKRMTRSDGTRQVTYNFHPLYRYAGDTQPGETSGEGLGGHWYVVGANGKRK
jgi:predicted lipoprotein with Yx(FWY)xxD motif